MRNFILSAAVIAIAGVSTVKANEIKSPIDSAAYTVTSDSTANIVKQDSAATMVRQDSASFTVAKDSAAYSVKQEDTKVPVKVEELPEPVKATLKADAYKEWTATGAFLITKADKSSYYQVDVKKDDKVAFLKVGADGVVQQ